MWVPDNYHFISQVVLPAKYRYKTYILFFILWSMDIWVATNIAAMYIPMCTAVHICKRFSRVYAQNG